MSEITPEEVAEQQHYNQPLRPQFHYTALQGHIGDATGLFFYRGEYHLFNIFDEWSRKSSVHKRWGHAISTDLMHWTQLPPVLDTTIDHSPGSGSGIVDWNNSSGLRNGPEKTLLLFYTDYKKGSCIRGFDTTKILFCLDLKTFATQTSFGIPPRKNGEWSVTKSKASRFMAQVICCTGDGSAASKGFTNAPISSNWRLTTHLPNSVGSWSTEMDRT
jgi:hypothetical protein